MELVRLLLSLVKFGAIVVQLRDVGGEIDNRGTIDNDPLLSRPTTSFKTLLPQDALSSASSFLSSSVQRSQNSHQIIQIIKETNTITMAPITKVVLRHSPALNGTTTASPAPAPAPAPASSVFDSVPNVTEPIIFSLPAASSASESPCQSGTSTPTTPTTPASAPAPPTLESYVVTKAESQADCQSSTTTTAPPALPAPAAPLTLGGYAVTKAEPQSACQSGTTTTTPPIIPAPAPAPPTLGGYAVIKPEENQSPAQSGAFTAPPPPSPPAPPASPAKAAAPEPRPWWAPVPKHCLSGGEAKWAYMTWCWEWQFVLYQRGADGIVWETHEEYMGGEFIMDPRDD